VSQAAYLGKLPLAAADASNIGGNPQVEESLMAAHKQLHLFEAKSADTRIYRDEPRVARVEFSLASGELLVVEIP
jgi:hypothetical protein